MSVDPGSRGWNEHRHLDPAWITRSQGLLVFDNTFGSSAPGVDIPINGIWTPFSQLGGITGGFSGLVVIDETIVLGHTALFLTGAGTLTLVAQEGTDYSTVQGTAGKINVYVTAPSAYAFTIENKYTSAIRVSVLGLRTRASQ